MRASSLCLGIAISLLWGGIAAAATLRAGQPQFSGDKVTVPIILEGDVAGGVSALNFRLEYDPNVLDPVGASVGAAAQAADRQVQANKSTDGQYNVVMMGMSQNTVTNGEVANIVLRRVANPQGGTSALNITETTLASLEGAEIPSQGSSSSIDFQVAPPQDSAAPSEASPQPRQNDATTIDSNDDSVNTGARPVGEAGNAAENAPAQNAADASARGLAVPGSIPQASAGTAAAAEQLAAALQRVNAQRAGLPTPASGAAGSNPEAATGDAEGPVSTTSPAAGAVEGQVPVSQADAAPPTAKGQTANGAVPATPAETASANGAASSGISGVGFVLVLGLIVLIALIVLARRFFLK